MVSNRQIGVDFFGLGVASTSLTKPLTKWTRSIRQEINGTFHLENVLIKEALKPQKITLLQQGLRAYPKLLISNPGIRVIIETIGEHSVALQIIQVKHSRGKHVVTSNKEVMAKQ